MLMDTFNEAQKKTTTVLPNIADYINPFKVHTMMNLYHAVVNLQTSLADPQLQKLDAHLAGLCIRFANETMATEGSDEQGAP